MPIQDSIHASLIQGSVNKKPHLSKAGNQHLRRALFMDELYLFVKSKAYKYWVWLALDVKTREVVGCYIGSRDRNGAQSLWDSLPATK